MTAEALSFPLRARLHYGDAEAAMPIPVQQGGCNGCHAAPDSYPPRLHVTDFAQACAAVTGPTVGDLPDDVNTVLRGRCQICHSAPPQNQAPFSLVSYEDTQTPFGITDKRKWQRMAQVIEPDGLPHMPRDGAPQLADSELATLREWFAACAPPIPEGTGHDLAADGSPEH